MGSSNTRYQRQYNLFLCSSEMAAPPLHIKTPLIPSPAMSKIVGRDVFLKLENLQPGGSFKIRGIGETMQRAVRQGVIKHAGHRSVATIIITTFLSLGGVIRVQM